MRIRKRVVTKEERVVRWLLFVVMAFTVPLPYYLFVIGGLVPFSALLVMFIRWLSGPHWLVHVVNGAHVIVYGLILYGLAKVAYLLIRRFPPLVRMLGVCAEIAIFLYVGSLALFDVGHADYLPVSAFEFFLRVLNE